MSLNLDTSHTEDLLADSGSDESAPMHRKASSAETSRPPADRITAVLPLSLEKIAVASQGGIRLLSLSSLSAGDEASTTRNRQQSGA